MIHAARAMITLPENARFLNLLASGKAGELLRSSVMEITGNSRQATQTMASAAITRPLRPGLVTDRE